MLTGSLAWGLRLGRGCQDFDALSPLVWLASLPRLPAVGFPKGPKSASPLHLRLLIHLLLAIATPLGLCGVGVAQQKTWEVAITKRPKGQPIVIDADLRDPAWASAVQLGPLTQVDPDEGARPTHPTIVRLMFDRDRLYIAVECREAKGEVRGRLMQRDANLSPDDRVEFWFDTFNDRRFAYWFQIGAGGSKGDALIGGGGFNKSWDGIWYGKSKITESGWQAEIAIPFKTIAFKEGADTWRFNLRRQRKANDEEDRWAVPLVAYQFFSISQGGLITGLTGIRHGVGLDVVPYAKVSTSRDRRTGKHATRNGDAGLDLSYRLSPALNLRLTYNTDFAETEVDARRTNLTRFPLFFPEKRDFFLEDAGLFSFGVSGRRPTLIPFFSRRVGRDDKGTAVPIIAGAKLTGRVDDWNLGLLSVYQDDHTDSAGKFSDQRALSVMRVSRNIGRESSVGMLATSGRPTDPGNAYTAGFDFHYGDSSAFGPGHDIDINGWWLGSFIDGPGGDAAAYGLQADYDSKEWDVSVTTNHVEKDFLPELGYVRRTGVREHRSRAQRTWRFQDFCIRRLEMMVYPRVTTNEAGGKDSWLVFVKPMEVTFASDDSIGYDVRREFWRLPEGFDIHDEITIPATDYYFTTHSVELETSEKRWIFTKAEVKFGGFYSGNKTTIEFSPTIILGPMVHVGIGYEQNNVNLDEGQFTTHTWSGRVDVSFSPDLSWKNLVQYDSDSKNLSAQTRVRWILEPGQELFLVGLYAWEKADHGAPFVPTTQESALKVLYTIRF